MNKENDDVATGVGRQPFWQTAEWTGGWMQGLGFGLLTCILAVQLPDDFFARVEKILITAGVVLIVAGILRVKSGRPS